jgi:hypothetical protein
MMTMIPKTNKTTATRIEIANFWFGPTSSGRVAIASCAIIGGEPTWSGSYGSELAGEALRPHNHLFGALRCIEQRPEETSEWARLLHRNLMVEGRESFHLSYGFMQRFSEAAQRRGLFSCVCAPYWAAVEAGIDIHSWPEGEAKALLCRAEINWSLGYGKNKEQRPVRLARL